MAAQHEEHAAAIFPLATSAVMVREDGEDLVAWARANGASVSGKVAFLQPSAGGDRCCIARTSISEDEVLLELPRALVFETPPARVHPRGVPSGLLSALASSTKPDTPGPPLKSAVVALVVHHEHMRGDASDFAQYLRCLPKHFPTIPPALHERDDVIDEAWLYRGTGVERLAETGAALACPAGVALMRALIEDLDPEGMWWHHSQRGDNMALFWAAAAVQSRAHSSKSGSRTVLVPLADAFNHSPSQPNVELCEDESSFQIRALRDMAAGEELLLCYGEFSNAELVFSGGFACPHNSHDCVLVSRAELLNAAQHRWHERGIPAPMDLEERFLLLAGPSPPRLRADGPLFGGAVPAAIITMLVGLSLDEVAWAKHTADGLGGLHDLWVGGDAVADGLRAEALEAVVVLCSVAQRRYRTQLADDREELRKVQTDEKEVPSVDAAEEIAAKQRRLNILLVRVGERSLLDKLMATAIARASAAAKSTISGASASPSSSQCGSLCDHRLTEMPSVPQDDPVVKRARVETADVP